MAEPVALVSSLIRELVNVLRWHGELVAGAKEEMKELDSDLGVLRAHLREASSKPVEQQVRKEMERRVRELVYDVEDEMAIWLTHAAVARDSNFIVRMFSPTYAIQALQVRTLRNKVEPIKKYVTRLDTQIADVNTQHSSLLHAQDETTGLENVVIALQEEERIVGYLKEDKIGLDVISIIGMPGIGKSTLAWRVYDNIEIRDEFPDGSRHWIPVSGLDSKEVLRRIDKELGGKDSALNSHELAPKVRARLEGNVKDGKLLLVLDDVQSVGQWETIRCVLPGDSPRIKVVITSREMKVGKEAKVTRGPVVLRPLNQKDSWDLLQLRVFGIRGSCPPQLKDLGESVAHQCGGVPLAIEAMARVLKEQWHTCSSSSTHALKLKWRNSSNRVGEVLEEDRGKYISRRVEQSYYRLRNDLRACFLYMGVFPENHVIPASTLVRLWIAEGFIDPTIKGKTMEESAEDNLWELIDSSLLEVIQEKNLDQIRTCRVPNIIHAFCRSKAFEQNLFTVVSTETQADPDLQNFHRLCLHLDLAKLLSQKLKYRRIRSLLNFFNNPSHLDHTHVSAIRDACARLRIFESKPIKFRKKIIHRVNKLAHLRYITLHFETLELIPKQISQLQYLQTLIIQTKSTSVKMRANLWKMIRLRHLKSKAAIVLNNKKWKDPLEGKPKERNLQTLSRLSSESCTIDVFNKVPELRRLGIRGRFNRYPQNLESVSLLTKLKRLTLLETFLGWDRMPVLARMSSLEVLKLKENAFVGSSWNAADKGFKSLQYLLVHNNQLEDWQASEIGFPCLRYLVLHNCKKLKEIPAGLTNNLEKIEIDNHLSATAAESARTIEQEKRQAQQQHQNLRWSVPFKLITPDDKMQPPNL